MSTNRFLSLNCLRDIDWSVHYIWVANWTFQVLVHNRSQTFTFRVRTQKCCIQLCGQFKKTKPVFFQMKLLVGILLLGLVGEFFPVMTPSAKWAHWNLADPCGFLTLDSLIDCEEPKSLSNLFFSTREAFDTDGSKLTHYFSSPHLPTTEKNA